MSAVRKPETLETIYDHAVTQQELNQLFYGSPEPQDDYAEGLSRESLLVDIARLYLLMGDTDTAARYVCTTGDNSIRSEFATRGCCDAHS